MAISFQDQVQLTCPACSAEFSASIWLILDVQEEPQALDALQRGELNQVCCPLCGHTGPAGAPLLFHDGGARRVIFAGAPGSNDHEIRDQARELHAVLVGSIPEEQRRPYLADVDIAQDLAGMAKLIQRQARRRTAPAAPPPETGSEQPMTDSGGQPPLLAAVQSLLAADTPDQLNQALIDHPILLDPTTHASLAELANVARAQGEPAIAESLERARKLLSQTSTTVEPQATDETRPETLVQAILDTQNSRELAELGRSLPSLLEPQTDQLLADVIDQALEVGNERLAQALESRREALAQLRNATPITPIPDASLEEAIEALLIADTPELIRTAIERYPVLLEDVAGEALWQFASEARASGDEEIAAYAVECREMLKRVRQGLAE
jgi:hypothetical protein